MSNLEVRTIGGTLRPGQTFWSMTDGVPVPYRCERIATSDRYPGGRFVISGDTLFQADDCFSTALECILAARIQTNQSRAYLRAELARSWYVAYLGRQANGTEEQPLVNLLHSGQTEEQVLSVLLSSQEFLARAQTLVPSGTPTSAPCSASWACRSWSPPTRRASPSCCGRMRKGP